MPGGSDTTQHNKVIGREALFALGLKRWGKEVVKAMCKTFNKVDKNTRKIGLFEDSFFKTLSFELWHSVFVAVPGATEQLGATRGPEALPLLQIPGCNQLPGIRI